MDTQEKNRIKQIRATKAEIQHELAVTQRALEKAHLDMHDAKHFINKLIFERKFNFSLNSLKLYTKNHRFLPKGFLSKLSYLLKIPMGIYSAKGYFLIGYPVEGAEFTDEVHKLLGIGFFPHHHKNSLRIGYIEKEDGVEIVLYKYKDGVRRIQPLLSHGEPFKVAYGNGFVAEMILAPDRIITSVETIDKRQRVDFDVFWEKPTILNYLLRPYFGGKTPAKDERYMEAGIEVGRHQISTTTASLIPVVVFCISAILHGLFSNVLITLFPVLIFMLILAIKWAR